MLPKLPILCWIFGLAGAINLNLAEEKLLFENDKVQLKVDGTEGSGSQNTHTSKGLTLSSSMNRNNTLITKKGLDKVCLVYLGANETSEGDVVITDLPIEFITGDVTNYTFEYSALLARSDG